MSDAKEEGYRGLTFQEIVLSMPNEQSKNDNKHLRNDPEIGGWEWAPQSPLFLCPSICTFSTLNSEFHACLKYI